MSSNQDNVSSLADMFAVTSADEKINRNTPEIDAYQISGLLTVNFY